MTGALLTMLFLISYQDAMANEIPEPFISLSVKDCVKLAIDQSFEVELARLDLLIAQTDMSLTEAAFDTFMLGGFNYSEDGRRGVSVFSPSLSQTNSYSMGASKKLKSGTLS